jgi:hypothetical protein
MLHRIKCQKFQALISGLFVSVSCQSGPEGWKNLSKQGDYKKSIPFIPKSKSDDVIGSCKHIVIGTLKVLFGKT